METQALTKVAEKMPFVFEDLFKHPGMNGLMADYGGRVMNVPAVNIAEQKDEYLVSLAAPGLKKEDFNINVDDNMLTISSKKEESKEEKNKKFTRNEYSYSSFSRSFTLPEEINKEKIDAKYVDGVLKISIPRKEEAKKLSAKHIAVK